MPSSSQERQHLVLLVTGEQRVLRLEGGDGMHGMGAADGADPGLGEADVADLAFSDQLGQGADRLLDGSVRIHPVLVVEVDVIRTKSPQ